MVKQVDKYVLEGEIGKGAMGSVWLSRHPGLNIPVAVKILDPTLAEEDPDYQDRFIKEGRLAASINHQHVVRVIDAGHDAGLYYLIMELIDGADAKQLLEKRGALPVEEVVELAICISEALSNAHSIGIVHRDIKPDNILVTSQGQVKLADLGIAKQVNEDYGTTIAGTTIGTPYYIAPEQAMDSSTVDCRCDIYALGATLYHLVTGTLPFTGPSAMAILMSHSQEPLQHPKERKDDLPDNICTVICKMMEKDPDDRYQNCTELLKDLKAVKNKKSIGASAKSKKQFKTPVKQRPTRQGLDKDLAGLPKASRSKRSKKKKGSSAPIVLILTVLFLIIGGVIALMNKGTQATEAAAPTEKEAPTATKPAASVEETPKTATHKTKKTIKKEIKKEFKRDAKNGNVKELIKAAIERDNPWVNLNINRIQMTKDGLSVDLNKLEIKNISSLKDFPIKVLRLSENPVSDYAALKKLELKHLEIFRSRSKLPLRHINFSQLKHLQIGLSDLENLNELSKYQGHYLSIKQHPHLIELIHKTPLYRLDMDSVGKPLKLNLLPATLKDLRLYGAHGIGSISGLSHLKLNGLYLINSRCDNIEVLKGMPLEYVSLVGTTVKDLSALANKPIKELAMPYHCPDLSFLSTLGSLKKLAIPRPLWRKELEQFRGKSIIIEGFDRKSNSWWLDWGMTQETSSYKFWKMFDNNRRQRR